MNITELDFGINSKGISRTKRSNSSQFETAHKRPGTFKRLKFVGASPRSRAGCLQCKTKKKKCDEKKPTCGLCERTNVVCAWSETTKPSAQHGKSSSDTSNDQPLANAIQASSFETELTISSPVSNIISSFPDFDTEIGIFNTPDFDDNILTWDLMSQSDNNPCFPLTMAAATENYLYNQMSHSHPLYYFPENLCTGKELKYLEHFIHSIASNISVVPSDTNYCLNFYLPMAIQDDALLNALISWGGMFLQENEGREYHQRAVTQMNANIEKLSAYDSTNNNNNNSNSNSNSNNKDKLIKTLACATVLQAVEISTGDVKNWVKFFRICANMIKRLGGIQALIHSKEEKFLASNFAFHDLLGTNSIINGTCFPVSEYEKLYVDGVQYIDSLQSCVGPLFVIMGDIFNSSKRLRKQLYQSLGNDGDNNSTCSTYEYNKTLTSQQKIGLLKEQQRQFQFIESRINSAYPTASEIEYFSSIDQLEHHLRVFELYQKVIKIILLQSMKNLAPESAEIQILVLECSEMLKELFDSPVKSLLCLAVVIVGFNTVDFDARAELAGHVSELQRSYKAANLGRAMAVVEESWRQPMPMSPSSISPLTSPNLENLPPMSWAQNQPSDFSARISVAVQRWQWNLSLV